MPHRAELSVAAIVVVLVLTTDLRGAIGFSSFGVLLVATLPWPSVVAGILVFAVGIVVRAIRLLLVERRQMDR